MRICSRRGYHFIDYDFEWSLKVRSGKDLRGQNIRLLKRCGDVKEIVDVFGSDEIDVMMRGERRIYGKPAIAIVYYLREERGDEVIRRAVIFDVEERKAYYIILNPKFRFW